MPFCMLMNVTYTRYSTFPTHITHPFYKSCGFLFLLSNSHTKPNFLQGVWKYPMKGKRGCGSNHIRYGVANVIIGTF